MVNFKKKHKRVLAYLIIIYSVFAVGISIIGVKYYYGQKQKLKRDFEKQITTITDLKVGEILQWRDERIQDGKIFYKNELLAEHIKEFFANKDASANKKKIETWLSKVKEVKDVETVFLLDTQLTKIFAVPNNSEKGKAFISPSNYDSLKSGKIVFEDLFRLNAAQKIYLKIFVPVFDAKDTTLFLGAVVVRIDPDVYLYSLVNSWPVPNETAETIILRGEGNELVFLNELKYEKNTALNLRFAQEKEDMTVVHAFKGKTGIVEGVDHRGVEEIAYILKIQNSPWTLVTSLNKSEIYAPMKEIFWWTVLTIAGILFMVGLIMVVFWREQERRFLHEQYNSAAVLRESEERFRLLFDEAPLGYQALDFDGNFIDVNQKWIDTLGYEREEVIGKWFGDFLAPEYKDAFRERFPLFKSRGEIHAEFDMLHKTGRHLFIAFDGRIGNNLDGTFKQTHCILKDVTEQRRAEAEQRLFRSLINQSSDSIEVIDPDTGRFIDGNEKAWSILGYTRDEFLTLTVPDIDPEVSLSKFFEIKNNIINNAKPFVLETIHKRKDGTRFPVEVSVSEVSLDKDYMITVARDISERKKAEDELRKSKQNWEGIFHGISHPTVILDAEHNVLEINESLREKLGKDLEEVKKLKCWEIFHEPGTTCPPNGCPFEQMTLSGTAETTEMEMEAFGGYYLINCTPMFDDEGKLEKVIHIATDITDRRNAEGEVLKLNRVYKVLSNVNQMIVRVKDVDIMFNDACKIAIRDGQFRMAWIGAVNKDTNKVDVITSGGITQDYLETINIDLSDDVRSQGPTGTAIKTGKHFISNDIANDERMTPWREDAKRLGYKSSASFPIKIFGEVLYNINLYSEDVNFFDEDEILLLDELVMDMSFAIEFLEKEKARKKAEEALLKSDELNKSILDCAGEGIVGVDTNGYHTFVNPKAAELLGYTVEELTPLHSHTAFHHSYPNGENYPCEKCPIYETVKDVKSHSGEEYFWRKDGTGFWAEFSSMPLIENEKIIGSVVTFRDITERKESIEIVKASEEKYRNLIETMPEGFYRSTPEGYFVDVNPAFVDMLGYDNKEDLMKVNIPEELYFTKEDREVDVHNINFTSDSEAYRLRKKDGSEIWVVDYGRYIKDDSGKVIFHEGIMRDVTESLRAQKAIINAKDKAEEMSRLKSSFLANMSHEIRTPLNGILGFAQLLQEVVKDDEQLKCVRVIEKSGNRLLETLDLILNFSKLEAEKVNALYRELNVCNVIEEVVDSFEAMARIKNLVIEKEIKQKNLVTKIDDRFLRHVLNNLVKNAVVYTNKGGITVTFDKDEKDMIFKVKDTGIGIAKEYYEVIFEPFRQESEGWGRNFEGTGLGLSITKRFVEMMKGKIEVESEVGVGSTFTVRLPYTEADTTTESKTRKKESTKKAPGVKTPEKKELSILLVENDEGNREYTLAVLDKYYKTDFAVDGQDAIDAAKKKVYDIILMDINLGKEIDGIMATQAIRKMKVYKDTPIVALTAYVREGDEEEFLAGGCTHFLGKPFTVKQLLDLIERIIKR